MKTPTHPGSRLLGRLLLLLGLVATLGLLARTAAIPAYAAHASYFTVSDCSDDSQLQQDVSQANQDNDGDTIFFDCSGDILLSRTLNITGTMFIDATGQNVTLDGGNLVQVFVVNSGVSLDLDSLTIAHGAAINGGGLINNGGTVNITTSTFENNSASSRSQGGAAGGGGLSNVAGTVNITTSTFENNSASASNGYSYGGGIDNEKGTLTITGSTFTNNSTGYAGGGLYSEGGTVTISNTYFESNFASTAGGSSFGGGITSASTMTITGSTFASNSASNSSGQAQGGGFYIISGTVTITNSNITNNQASAPNGNSDGGGFYNDGTVSINDSIVSGNSTSSGSGGGFYNNNAVNISESTVSGNSTPSQGGGFFNDGTVSISASTFANNSALDNGGGGLLNIDDNGKTVVSISNSTIANNSASSGGGLYNEYGQKVSIGGSIVANNSGHDCGNYDGPITDNGYNLSSDGSCGFTGTGDLQNTDPKLDPNGLQNNGGPTQTIALEQGSPAIDQVPLAQCPATDQRGVTRPDENEAVCDMGAYESNYTVSLTLNGTSVTATEGASFSGVVASGSYSGNGTLSAAINWGDGSAPTSGTINGSSNFFVTGSHTYAEEGNYTITVTVSDGQGQSASATSPTTVNDAALTLTQFGANPMGHHKASLSATFTDADPNGQVSDYTATINWGDGMSSTVKVGKAAGHLQGFDLSQLHTYAQKGSYTLTLTVVDQGGSQVSKTVTIKVF